MAKDNLQAAKQMFADLNKRYEKLAEPYLKRLDTKDPNFLESLNVYKPISELREILITEMINSDVESAYEFMIKTKEILTLYSYFDTYLEDKIIQISTKKALRIVRKMNASKFKYKFVDVLSCIRNKDKKEALKFESELVKKILSESKKKEIGFEQFKKLN